MDPNSPYASPPDRAFEPAPSVAAEHAPDRRPGSVTAIAIILLILSALGLLGCIWGTIALVAGQKFQQAMIMSQPNANSPQQQVIARHLTRIQQISDRWLPVTVTALVLKFVVDGGLLWGAIQVLRNRPAGRRQLIAFLRAAIVFDLVSTAAVIPMQMQIFRATAQYMEEELGSTIGGGNMPPAAAQAMQTTMTVIMFFGIGFTAAWVIAKLVFYLISLRVLNRPEVIAFFERKPFTAELV